MFSVRQENPDFSFLHEPVFFFLLQTAKSARDETTGFKVRTVVISSGKNKKINKIMRNLTKRFIILKKIHFSCQYVFL